MSTRRAPWGHGLRRCLWGIAWAGLGLVSPVRAELAMDEAQLRAALVLRLAQYTQWPEVAQGEFQLCVAGLSRGDAELQALAQRRVGAQTVRVRRLEHARDVGAQCQLLLLGHGDAAALRRWMAPLAEAPVLVVGTSPEALRAGVCIALINEPQGMAFSVNHGELRRRGLSVDAPVLRLAREVR